MKRILVERQGEVREMVEKTLIFTNFCKKHEGRRDVQEALGHEPTQRQTVPLVNEEDTEAVLYGYVVV